MIINARLDVSFDAYKPADMYYHDFYEDLEDRLKQAIEEEFPGPDTEVEIVDIDTFDE